MRVRWVASAALVSVLALPLLGPSCGGKGGSSKVFKVETSSTPHHPPVVTGVVPRRGPVAGGTAITIFGANFVAGATTVTINGTNLPVNVVSSGQLTATTPPLPSGTDPSATIVVVVNGSAGGLNQAFGYIQAITNPSPGGAGTDDFGGTTRTLGATTAAVVQSFPGDALAVGDFNRDGVRDLAVGVPSRTVRDSRSRPVAARTTRKPATKISAPGTDRTCGSRNRMPG